MPRYQDQLASGVLSPKRCSTESPLEVWEMAIFLEMWREQSPTLLGQDVSLVLKLPGVRRLRTVSSLLQEFQPQRVQMCSDVSRWPRGLPTRHAGFVLTRSPLYQLAKLTF